ncbi:YsnF/AvaK domain-containing protein [Nostoc sp. FACHB-110]|uniref:YsnF/AvaK domain-containing protein n=1 Tax=Nostoc sp. FACHB-110 TaxID=2692834 RepID=UPI001682F772|nr:DUF2382 domain-containing protein [Nostoc sp. FACHB-110]MBD2435668.1 DUF2382 domain-containing protein [Nostoc sp. FACHB-110]
MNSQSRANSFERVNQKSSISNLLTTLKNKVAYFDVIDNQGQIVGKVRDLILDHRRRLNLVISPPSNFIPPSLALVWSQKIQRIDTLNKSIFLNVNILEVEYMSEDFKSQLTNQSYEPLDSSGTINEDLTEISEENIIRLLEEKLVVDSSIQKIGEVIVRKEIETRMVQVPVRREKLIVEQVSPQHKQLAEINLSSETLADIDGAAVSQFAGDFTVTGDFDSPKIASLILNAIALEKNHGCQRVRVSIVCDNESHQQKYQEWFERCSKQ